MEQELLSSAHELDFSLVALYWRATLTVKLVMILLVIASFWSWAIIFQKLYLYWQKKRAFEGFLRVFWSSASLDELHAKIGKKSVQTVGEKVFFVGLKEWQNAFLPDNRIATNWQQRVERVIDLEIAKESGTLNKYLGFLASVGSTAPFIGLFGTVWGIKNSFEQISIAQNTDLTVVAPGIAEALLATGLGLLAAIPAVIFYNKLLNDSEALITGVEHFIEDFVLLLMRETG